MRAYCASVIVLLIAAGFAWLCYLHPYAVSGIAGGVWLGVNLIKITDKVGWTS